MASTSKEPFRLPAPKFQDETSRSLDSFTKLRNPHFSTPSGMLLPRDKQPPPMFGPRGSTIPPRFLNQKNHRGRGGHRGGYNHHNQGQQQQHHRFRGPAPQRGGHFNRGNHGSDLDRDVIPELLQINWALWCEKCDFNSRTEEELARHCAEHRGCEVEGCSFVGHPGVMKRHWRLAHDEQRQQEKAALDTKQSPEEIDAWREQRRQRYPTKANVERRQQAQEERFSRGERIEEDKSRFGSRGQNQQQQDQKGRESTGSIKNERGRQRKRFKRGKTNGTVVEDAECGGEDESRLAFKGTSGLKDYKEKAKTALSLLSGYGSDSGETSSEQEEEPAVEEQVDTINESNLSEGGEGVNPESLHISDEDEGEPESVPETEQNQQTEDQPSTTEEKPGNRRNRTRKRKNRPTQEDQPKPIKVVKSLLDYSKLRYARQNTMLEKLLDKDIRHERNVLLQCVRFVVDNKFFGIGQPKQDEPIVENANKDV